MLPTNTLIEIHYFSGGLKTILFGTPKRPEWLPEHDLVGLHNDVYPINNEFIIELSRHKRKDYLITWIGVHTKGKDAIYGDRSNYLGIGLWLINTLPIEVAAIINALIKICQLLVMQGPTNDKIKLQCEKFLDEYLPSWIINISSRVNRGVAFETTQQPVTAYVQSTNDDIEVSIKQIAHSVLLNCIYAEEYARGASRILYLPLNTASNAKEIKQLSSNTTTVRSLVEYFTNSVENIALHNQKLAEKNRSLDELNSDNAVQIENLTKELEYLNRFNQKTPGRLIEDLEVSVKNLPTLSIDDKRNLLRLINAIEKNRAIRHSSNNITNSNIVPEEYYENLMSELKGISKNVNYLKNKLDTPSDNQSDSWTLNLSYRAIIGITLGVVILGGILFLMAYYFSDSSLK